VGPGLFKLLLTLATSGLANENIERIPIISRNLRQLLGENRKRAPFHDWGDTVETIHAGMWVRSEGRKGGESEGWREGGRERGSAAAQEP
jgi:hypothetical protein